MLSVLVLVRECFPDSFIVVVLVEPFQLIQLVEVAQLRLHELLFVSLLENVALSGLFSDSIKITDANGRTALYLLVLKVWLALSLGD